MVTACEVRRHAREEDVWIVADGIVFDVTSYLDEHPGGARSLVRRGGGAADCGEDFFFHSRRGKHMWERFRIGRVVPCDTRPSTSFEDASLAGCSIL